MKGTARRAPTNALGCALSTSLVLMVSLGPIAPAAHAAPVGSAPRHPVTSDPRSPGDTNGVNARIRATLGRSADSVAVVAYDRVSDRAISYNGQLQNCAGSIVKVMVLLALLDGRGATSLSANQRALAARMIQHSDNDAANALLSQAGGHAAVDRLARRLGMTATSSQAAWGRTTTNAADQARLMRALVDGHDALSDDGRAYVLDLMGQVAPDQRWGAGAVPVGVTAQVKNGWVPLEPHGWRVNSLGHVKGAGRDYTIAMLSLDNASMEAGVSTLDQTSKIVFDAFAPLASSTAGQEPGRNAAHVFAPHPLW